MSKVSITLSKERMKERKTVTVQVQSPIHIGTREGKLIALEFVAYDGNVYIIDEDRFGKYLIKRNLIDFFVQEAKTGRLKMYEFLKTKATRGALNDVLPEISSRIIPGGNIQMNEFRPHIRDGNGQIFIPGSSLKGVFRTALLYYILKHDNHLLSKMQQKATSGLRERLSEYRKKHFSSDWLQKDNIQNFFLPSGKPGPYEDFLRCMTIRDTYPLDECKTQIIKLKFLSKANSGKFYWSQQKGRHGSSYGKDLEVWVEAITDGTFVIDLVWDNEIYNTFSQYNSSLPIKGIDDFIHVVKIFSHALIEHEREFFKIDIQKISKGLSAQEILRRSYNTTITDYGNTSESLQKWYGSRGNGMLRIGFGSGMLSTTIDLAFDENVRQQIRNICGHNREDDPAPKSRRIWQHPDGKWLPMGWMAIK